MQRKLIADIQQDVLIADPFKPVLISLVRLQSNLRTLNMIDGNKIVTPETLPLNNFQLITETEQLIKDIQDRVANLNDDDNLFPLKDIYAKQFPFFSIRNNTNIDLRPEKFQPILDSLLKQKEDILILKSLEPVLSRLGQVQSNLNALNMIDGKKIVTPESSSLNDLRLITETEQLIKEIQDEVAKLNNDDNLFPLKDIYAKQFPFFSIRNNTNIDLRPGKFQPILNSLLKQKEQIIKNNTQGFQISPQKYIASDEISENISQEYKAIYDKSHGKYMLGDGELGRLSLDDINSEIRKILPAAHYEKGTYFLELTPALQQSLHAENLNNPEYIIEINGTKYLIAEDGRGKVELERKIRGMLLTAYEKGLEDAIAEKEKNIADDLLHNRRDIRRSAQTLHIEQAKYYIQMSVLDSLRDDKFFNPADNSLNDNDWLKKAEASLKLAAGNNPLEFLRLKNEYLITYRQNYADTQGINLQNSAIEKPSTSTPRINPNPPTDNENKRRRAIIFALIFLGIATPLGLGIFALRNLFIEPAQIDTTVGNRIEIDVNPEDFRNPIGSGSNPRWGAYAGINTDPANADNE